MFSESIESTTVSDFIQPQLNNSIMFIDAAVASYQDLVAAATQQVEMVVLDSTRDGIAQISEELAQRSNIDSVHIVSHGQAGSIQLGTTQLNLSTIADNSLSDWSEALTDTADIFLYGCHVAAGNEGQAFIQGLSDLTEADIAASTDLTGSSSFGGDWELEATTGEIEASIAFQPEVATFDGVLAGGHDMKEHMELLNLVPQSLATNVAVKNGSWFNASTWQDGKVPGNNADVLIPEGLTVVYDAQSEARLDTLRVDGKLEFSSNRDTKMLIDTFVVAPQGSLLIGSKANPVQANNSTQIIFTSEGAIDTKWDPTLLSRGLISHGQARIYGADKLDFVPLAGNAVAGDSELVLDLPNGMGTPAGWQVGDQLVLGGTEHRYSGSDANNTRFQDEVLTITEINGNRIRFTNNDIASGNKSVLRFDHELPEGFANDELQLYIANTTRNVTFETENGKAVPTQERGHVMFMHNPDVEVNNAGFYYLGRTDKSKLIDDPGQNVDGSKGFGQNPRGRYSLHLHRTGADNINSTPAIAKGNAVIDSPGWGIVQHDSHALLEDNVVFDVAGSGIAAEAGNEIGWWRNNLTIKTTGDGKSGFNPVTNSRRQRFDFGFKGEGYWVQGAAQVGMENNIAISAAGGALSLFAGADFSAKTYRDAPTFPVANLTPQQKALAAGGATEVDVTNLPLRRLSGFESYNTAAGMVFWHHMANEDGQLEFNEPGGMPAHNLRSLVEDFRMWNIFANGIHLQYTSQVDFVDGMILGEQGKIGIRHNDASQNLSYSDMYIAGFNEGFQIPREGDEQQRVPFLGSRLQNSTLVNNIDHISRNETLQDTVEYFEIANTTFDSASNNAAPIAQFSNEAAGGLGRHFDASQSSDRDAPRELIQIDNAIVSYGWDWNSDGTIDEYGRQASHVFGNAGTHQVSLTVWDSQGATDTVTQTVQVTPVAYENLLDNGDFSAATSFGGKAYRVDSKRAGEGWIASSWSRNSNLGDGAAVVSGGFSQGLGQVILDQRLRRGEQTLSLDVKNTEGNKAANELTITVWGINGEFNAGRIWESGPQAVGAMPMTNVKLLEESVGGSTFDWQTFNWNLNLQDGYQFIMVQITTDGVNTKQGDYVALNSVSIK